MLNQNELKRRLNELQSTLDALNAYERKLYWNAQSGKDTAEAVAFIQQGAEILRVNAGELLLWLQGGKNV